MYKDSQGFDDLDAIPVEDYKKGFATILDDLRQICDEDALKILVSCAIKNQDFTSFLSALDQQGIVVNFYSRLVQLPALHHFIHAKKLAELCDRFNDLGVEIDRGHFTRIKNGVADEELTEVLSKILGDAGFGFVNEEAME